MNENDKNHFEFFQRMPFYLMAPNGKIIDWSPKSSQEVIQKFSIHRINHILKDVTKAVIISSKKIQNALSES